MKSSGMPLREGSWVPRLTFNIGQVGMAWSTAKGRYSRVGRMVFVSGSIVLTAKGTSAGEAYIRDLPFPVKVGWSFSTNINAYLVNTTFTGQVLVTGMNGNAICRPYYTPEDGSPETQLTDANFTDTSEIHLSGVYITS